MVGLKSLAYSYIKSITPKDLQTNRQALIDRLRRPGKDYIESVWGQKEERIVRLFTHLNFNLGIHSS